MQQGGVTGINTAKSIARKLYMQYCNSAQMERLAIENMLVDTYKIMVPLPPTRTNSISPPPATYTSTTTSSTSTETAESPSTTSKH